MGAGRLGGGTQGGGGGGRGQDSLSIHLAEKEHVKIARKTLKATTYQIFKMTDHDNHVYILLLCPLDVPLLPVSPVWDLPQQAEPERAGELVVTDSITIHTSILSILASHQYNICPSVSRAIPLGQTSSVMSMLLVRPMSLALQMTCLACGSHLSWSTQLVKSPIWS